MKIQSVQRNKYNSKPNVNFGMDLRTIKGLEEIFPEKSVHEISQFKRLLDAKFEQTGSPGCGELDIKRVDDKFIEATLSGLRSRGPLTCRFSECSIENLVSMAYKSKNYFFRDYNAKDPGYKISREWHVE